MRMLDCPIKGTAEVPAQGQNAPQLFGVILQDPVYALSQDLCMALCPLKEGYAR